MAKGRDTYLEETREQQNRLDAKGVHEIFDPKFRKILQLERKIFLNSDYNEKKVSTTKKVPATNKEYYAKKGEEKKMYRPNQFETNLNKLLDAAEEMHKNSPPTDLVEKRREYAKKGKEEIARLLETLFPNTYERERAVRMARSKVFNGEIANGTYFFIDPTNASWVGKDVRIQLHLKEMAKKLILAIPERLNHEGKAELRQKIVDVLTTRKQITELIAFADEQEISFTNSRIAELVEALDNEKRYGEARKLLEFSGEAFEVRRLIAEKKAAAKAELKSQTPIALPASIMETEKKPFKTVATPTPIPTGGMPMENP